MQESVAMKPLDKVIEELQQALEQMEMKLGWEDLPVAALEEFKDTVDRARTSLQAFLDAADPADYHTSLTQVRLRRAAGVCQSVFAGVINGTIGKSTPGFDRLSATVNETSEQMEKLLGGGGETGRT